jgi:CDP-diacylglycerol--serine O-phosphatidyltransferase
LRLTIFAGVTMVSNIRYYSFKDINLRKSVPFLLMAAIALALRWLPTALKCPVRVLRLYGLSGYVLAALGMVKRKTGHRHQHVTALPEQECRLL